MNFSRFVVELVAHGLLDSLHVLARSWFFLFCLPFDLFKFSLSGIFDFLLDLVLIGASVNVVSLKAEMDDQLINSIILFIFPIEVVIHGAIEFCLRVGDN